MNKTLLALIVSLAALTLVACGDKDDDTGSGDEDSGS
jgi:predicted small lipoprotein YifL